jgi:hypothetical protein
MNKHILIALVLTGLLGACSDREDHAFVQRKHDEYVQSLRGAAPDPEREPEQQALDMVKKYPAQREPDDGKELTVEGWIKNILDNEKGEILFPKWDVRRRGFQHYEVRFTYTVIEPDYSINKRGYSWNVDVNLKMVAPHVELDTETLEQESGHRPLTRGPEDFALPVDLE